MRIEYDSHRYRLEIIGRNIGSVWRFISSYVQTVTPTAFHQWQESRWLFELVA